MVLIVLGMSANMTTSLQSQIGTHYYAAAQAFYIADAGVQRATRNLKADTGWIGTLGDPSDAFTGNNALGNGTYVVEAFQDDPNPGEVRIRSTGAIAGTSGASATVEIVAEPGQPGFPVFDFGLFACGNVFLNDGVTNVINGDVFVAGNTALQSYQIQGTVWGDGNLSVLNDSFIVGDVFADGNVTVTSSAALNIDGDLTNNGSVTGSGGISGTTTTDPNPVTDHCSSLNDFAITATKVQEFRDNADTTITGNVIINVGDTVTYTDIVHITGNLDIMGDAVLADSVVFVVDGNTAIGGSLTSSPPGSSVTVVSEGNISVDGSGGSVTLDGALHLAGSLTVLNGTSWTINGSVVSLGNVSAATGGTLNINYQPSNDPNIGGQNFTLKQWREVRN